MKAYQTEEYIMINHIKEQLHELGFKATEGMTRRELVVKLSVLRAQEVEVQSPHNSRF